MYNRTGLDIDSLYIADKYFGNLKRDSNSTFIALDSIGTDSGFPYDKLRANCNNVKVKQYNYSRCGSQRCMRRSGKYEFDLLLFKTHAGELFILLDKHSNTGKSEVMFLAGSEDDYRSKYKKHSR